jgi:putative transposase
MTTYRSLNHTKWHCQYHVVLIPKYRRKAMYGGLRQELGEVFRRLAVHRESEVEEGHLLPDHVHMMMSIPPKSSVAQVIDYLKGKSAIHIAREFAGRSRGTTLLGSRLLRLASRGEILREVHPFETDAFESDLALPRHQRTGSRLYWYRSGVSSGLSSAGWPAFCTLGLVP